MLETSDENDSLYLAEGAIFPSWIGLPILCLSQMRAKELEPVQKES